jgi:hypothetical protein
MKLLAAAVLLVSTQAAGAPQPMPPSFGSLASKFDSDDLQQISKLATRMGGSVWVVFGDTGLLSGSVWGGEVHKKPSVVGGGVRMGELLWVVTDIKPDQSKRLWRIDGVGVSAQVPVEGRRPDEVTSDMDPNRPFRVHGQWTAEELAGLVWFIRSSPRSTNPKRGLPQVNGTLPIWAVWRDADGAAQVGMRVKAREVHRVELVRQGEAWVVTSIRLAVVD